MARELIKTIESPRDNIIINGNFSYWQRAASASASINVAQYLAADRWRISGSITNNSVTMTRSTDVPSESDSKYSMIFGASSTASNSNTARLVTQVESIFTKKLKLGEYATLAFWVKAGSASSAGFVRILASTSVDSAGVTTILSSTVVTNGVEIWEKKYFHFLVTAEVLNGVHVEFSTTAPTSFQTRTIYVADVMIIPGRQIPSKYVLTGIDLANELQLCQRYYEKSYGIEVAPGTATTSGSHSARASGTSFTHTVPFTTRKRPGTQSVVVYSTATGASGTIRNDSAPAEVSAGLTITSSEINYRVSGFTSVDNNQYSWQWVADSEL